jgi:hypothetical protein
MITPQCLRPGVWILAAMFLSPLQSPAQENSPSQTDSAPRTVTRTVAPNNANPASDESGHPADVLPAHFQVTVYEVQANADRLTTLDRNSLSQQAATPESLLKVLAEAGRARILYRVNQPVNVYSERIMIGTSEPVVTATRTDARGQVINSLRYQNAGLTIKLAAQQPTGAVDGSKPNVKMSIELAVLSPSDTEVAQGRKATTTSNLGLEHSEPLEFNRPMVMVAVRAASPAEQLNPLVHVIRYMFSPPAGK